MPVQLASMIVPMQPEVLAWSPDGALLASADMGGGDIFIVDVAKAAVVKTLKAEDGVKPGLLAGRDLVGRGHPQNLPPDGNPGS